jgi:membrane protein implicated in regulation of membrane protease activity
MIDLLSALGPWNWFILGGVLLIAEIMAPGAFMLWLGLAAIVVGFLSFAVAWTWQIQSLAFVVLSIAAFPLWRRFGRPGPAGADSSFLNRRHEALVGRVFTLDKPIIDGAGTVRVDDTVWRIQGADLPAGTRIRVVRADGGMLGVEAAT